MKNAIFIMGDSVEILKLFCDLKKEPRLVVNILIEAEWGWGYVLKQNGFCQYFHEKIVI